MNTEMKNTLIVTEKEEQYDECAKRILAQKRILAEILINAVREFEGMCIEEVVPLIDGDPSVGKIPVEPGATNRVMAEKIVGSNTENSEMYEGMIRYDIVFYVWMRYGLTQMIINIEAQKDEPTEYDILNRAVFYICRMISSQKERDFVKSNYNDMKPVYSIWICMNMGENSMAHIHLTERRLAGDHTFKGNLDLINIIMLGVPNNPDKLLNISYVFCSATGLPRRRAMPYSHPQAAPPFASSALSHRYRRKISGSYSHYLRASAQTV